jgi:phage shock protein A
MAESIFIRVQRVLSAGADSAADALERASGTALMREAIREVDRVGDRLSIKLEAAEARRHQAKHQEAAVREKIATLAEQARYALGKGREDLAEAAISQQIHCETQLVNLKKVQSDSASEARGLEENLAALKARKSEMQKELESVEAALRSAESSGSGAKASSGMERKVARAEEAFERAMSAVGRAAGLADAGDAAKLAEVDEMQRQDEIAERLAALRAAQSPKKGKKAR